VAVVGSCRMSACLHASMVLALMARRAKSLGLTLRVMARRRKVLD